MKLQWKWINLIAFIICGIAAVLAFKENRWLLVLTDTVLCIVNGCLFVLNKEKESEEKKKPFIKQPKSL